MIKKKKRRGLGSSAINIVRTNDVVFVLPSFRTLINECQNGILLKSLEFYARYMFVPLRLVLVCCNKIPQPGWFSSMTLFSYSSGG